MECKKKKREAILPDSRYPLDHMCVWGGGGGEELYKVGIKHGVEVSKEFEDKLGESLTGIPIFVFQVSCLSTEF